MLFATPVLRRANFATAADADLALQRFLQGALSTPASNKDVQVTRDEKTTTLTLDVPGLRREELELQIEGDTVRLSSVENAPRQVKRAWKLDHEVEIAASHAKLENGVLTLTLAKLAPQSKALTLAIE